MKLANLTRDLDRIDVIQDLCNKFYYMLQGEKGHIEMHELYANRQYPNTILPVDILYLTVLILYKILAITVLIISKYCSELLI